MMMYKKLHFTSKTRSKIRGAFDGRKPEKMTTFQVSLYRHVYTFSYTEFDKEFEFAIFNTNRIYWGKIRENGLRILDFWMSEKNKAQIWNDLFKKTQHRGLDMITRHLSMFLLFFFFLNSGMLYFFLTDFWIFSGFPPVGTFSSINRH